LGNTVSNIENKRRKAKGKRQKLKRVEEEIGRLGDFETKRSHNKITSGRGKGWVSGK
jgi:hypothetical protein